MITAMFKDDTQLFKLFQDNSTFRRWLTDTIFAMTYEAYRGGVARDGETMAIREFRGDFHLSEQRELSVGFGGE
ncbi:MAG: hypothetical protein ACKPJD_04845 [Planctomycetaceae bacterium]